jgi:rhodanese-related sulfurtransferase
MKSILVMITLLISLLSTAQNPVGFDKMAKNMAGKKAPFITQEALKKILASNNPVVILDSREQKEYDVSHLPNAIWVGYDQVNWKKIESLNKNSTIVIYCSVGYRSGKLTEELLKKGFKNTKNLYGGLFNWVNNGSAVETSNHKKTTNVHGYDEKWSQWLNPTKATIVL